MRGTWRLMNTLVESLILPKLFWPLMGCLVISPRWFQNFKGGQVLFGELWLPRVDKMGYGELIAILRVARTHLSRFHLNPLYYICIFLLFNFSCNFLLQTFLNHATILFRVPDVNSLGIGEFVFSSPFDEFVNNFIEFGMKTCCIIVHIGLLCLYRRSTSPSWSQRKCILLMFKPWLLFTLIHDPLLWIYLHPHVCVPSQKIHS
jgi:hypothetical protein